MPIRFAGHYYTITKYTITIFSWKKSLSYYFPTFFTPAGHIFHFLCRFQIVLRLFPDLSVFRSSAISTFFSELSKPKRKKTRFQKRRSAVINRLFSHTIVLSSQTHKICFCDLYRRFSTARTSDSRSSDILTLDWTFFRLRIISIWPEEDLNVYLYYLSRYDVVHYLSSLNTRNFVHLSSRLGSSDRIDTNFKYGIPVRISLHQFDFFGFFSRFRFP